ncbi:hypothetical protein ACQZV8_12600, partial [Magnetococcales bacterium HHB-1]
FGRWLNQPPATQMQKIEQAAFMLTTTDALVLNNLNEAQAALRSQKRIDTTLTEEQYQFDFDISQSWGLFYTPLTLFDSKLCLILPVSMESSQKMLNQSRKRLLVSSLFIVLILILLSLIFYRMILTPLNRLRKQATRLIDICAEKPGNIPLHGLKHGNEIYTL